VGAQMNTSPYEFSEIYRIGDEARGDSILFANHESAEIAVNSANYLFIGGYEESPIMSFSDEGHFVGFVGVKGEGPGEFSHSTNIIVGPGDSLYVFDLDLGRLQVFEPTTLRYAYSINTPAPSKLVGVANTGYIFRYRQLYRPQGSPGGYDPDKPRYSLVRLMDRQGDTQQTPLAKLPTSERVVRTSGSYISVIPLPFGRDPFFTYRDGLLYAGWNDTIDISVISENGETIRTIKVTHEVSPVTKREIDAKVSVFSRRNRRAIRRSGLLPETKPAYDALIVDDYGNIWIRKFPEPNAEYTKWLIIDSEGTLLGEMELPSNLLLKTIKAGRAYASINSEKYGPYVVVYRVTMR